jgi:RES domain-containing protein
VPSRELVARVDALGTVSFEGHAFRHVSRDRDPRSGVGARLSGGRWNPRDSFSTLYLGLEISTVVAEFNRLAERQALAPTDFLPRDLYRFDVRLERLLDLRGADARSALDVTDERLRATDAAFCQEIGAAAHTLAHEGVIAPSATGNNTVLAVFLDNLLPRSLLEPTLIENWETPPEADS